MADVKSRFDALMSGVPGTAVDIRDTNNNVDPFVENDPLASRVIIGGSIDQLGIPTIGIAEHIDPANFSTNDTAVVLLDLLSAPRSNPNSILSLLPADATTDQKIEAVASVVGAVVAHEACHFLGCWHTENTNAVQNIIDRGGNLANLAGAGNDGELLTDDDLDVTIVKDHYALEGVGRPVDVQHADLRVLAALAVGKAPTSDPIERFLEVNLAHFREASRDEKASIPAFKTTRQALGLEPSGEEAVRPNGRPFPSRFERAIHEIQAELEAIQKK